jgi:hypothetical protein
VAAKQSVQSGSPGDSMNKANFLNWVDANAEKKNKENTPGRTGCSSTAAVNSVLPERCGRWLFEQMNFK